MRTGGLVIMVDILAYFQPTMSNWILESLGGRYVLKRPTGSKVMQWPLIKIRRCRQLSV